MLGCFSRPKRPSSTTATTTTTIFNSLYKPPSHSKTLTLTSSSTDPDLISSAMASNRLFSASPGSSNSILDSPAGNISLRSAGVAVPTYTPDPYSDFRRSMEEMAVAIGVSGRGTGIDLAVLRELLICYLELNRKQTHRYIVSAFVDLVVSRFGDEKGLDDE